jgi:hypothetical protein
VAIVAILREPVSQGFHLLAQAAHLLTVLLDQGVLLREQLLLLLDGFIRCASCSRSTLFSSRR